MRENKKLTVGFIVLAVIVCLLYTLWGQANTANSIYDAVVHYEGMDYLLGADEDFSAVYAGSAALADAAEQFKNENNCDNGVFPVDGAEIAYRFYDLGSDRTAVLLHSYWRSGEDMLIYAPYWAEQGFNVLAVDLRGFGASTGETSLGYYESGDVTALVQHLRPEDSLVLHGVGMGAVAALRAADAENVSLVVAQDAFSELESYTAEFSKRQFSLPRISVIWCTNNVVKKNQGFELADNSALAAVMETDTPCLFIAGAEAEFVPAEMTVSLYEACAAADKQLWLAPEAGFGAAYATDPEGYENVINEALELLY